MTESEPAIPPSSVCDCTTFLSLRNQIDRLLRDNARAGQLGQALLVRHESFVADAEQERCRMMDKIEALERTNTALEDRNRDTIGENRLLLDQLESLNSAVKESESKVHTLTDELQSTDLELKRMTNLASRTNELQTELVQLEEDLAAVTSASSFDREEGRVAKLRWQQAEKTIETLELQIERIESDAKEERERHADVGWLAVAGLG
jgi:chromosome segregation ATPase